MDKALKKQAEIKYTMEYMGDLFGLWCRFGCIHVYRFCKGCSGYGIGWYFGSDVVWNDYLLPTLVLDIKKYKTIPMLIQYFRGSYGKVEMGPMMACIMLTVIPIIIIYILGQKHIIKGVAAGAVKG